MQEILGKYKERLINISSRNRSLVMKKIYKKYSFDLFKLKKFSENIDKEIVDFLINRKSTSFKIVTDPYKWEDEEIKRIKKELKIELEKKVENLNQKGTDKLNLNENIKKLREQYEIKTNTELDKIKKKTEEIIDYSQSLTYLLREINSIEKETGRYELYIGYSFAEGYFKDKTFVKAPLLLFPIRIKKQADEWYLENIMDQSIVLNKVFLLAFSKYNGINLKDMDTEFEDLKEVGFNETSILLKYLEDNGIVIKYEKGQPVEKFFEHSSDTKINYSAGEIVLKNYLILGQFPVANSIYNDYLALEKVKVKNKLLKKLLINNECKNDEAACTKDKEETIEKIKEEEFYFLTDLDFSQEKAIKMVNKTSQLVVYGPPGTGKSQTIANMISDGLSKGKKILMVSQKRAALDVIYNRISKINSKVILLHDANKDKKTFYEKAARHLEEITFMSISQITSSIKQKANRIDENLDILDKIGEVLHSKRNFGLTLQQMYSKTKKISSKEDKRYEDFKKFRNSKNFERCTYSRLVNSIEKVNTKEVIENYCKFKKYLDDNKVILIISQDIDCFEIDDFIDKMEELKEKYNNEVKLKLEQNPYSNKLLELYINRNKISDEEIFKLGKEINNIENKELLTKLNDGKWWSIVYWLNYSKNKKLEEANKVEFDKKEKEICKKLQTINNDIKNFINDIEFIKNVLIEKEHENLLEDVYKGNNLTDLVDGLINSLSVYEEYRNLIASLKPLGDFETKLLEYAYKNSDNEEHMKSILSSIPDYSILFNIGKIEQKERDILVKYSDFYKITEETNRFMKDKQNLVPKHIDRKWNGKLQKVIENNNNKKRELKRQAEKKRMLWPIRKYIGEFHDILFDLFPCWLLSPETVSEVLPLIEEMFDLIIFDEASQMFVEDAIPTIYRGKSVVIAGDDKQLKPSTTFKVKFDDEEECDNLETAAALEEESLLDLAKVNYDAVHLNYHYRSKSDELINFSNYAFYNGRLEISPNIVKTDSIKEKPIERIKIDGRWIGRKNIEESEKVVELVNHILRNRKKDETIGIITFNVTQKDLIDDMLENRANKDSQFKELFYKECERMDGDEDISLFIKNIENVQGDERDIIIFSTGYAPNENGKILVNFGSLSQDGGENRLNVAISRAKSKIYIVTSIEPENLAVENTKNNGPKLFKKYLQYAREVSQGKKEMAISIITGLLDSQISKTESITLGNDFEIQVYKALIEKGYEVDTEVGVSSYKIDLAIYDSNTSRYVLGIECDNTAYHSSKYARERDINRQKYLESRGWKIIRIWSKDWWENPEEEIEKIENVLKEYIKLQLKEIKKEVIDINEVIHNQDKMKNLELSSKVEQKPNIDNKIRPMQTQLSNAANIISIGYGDTVKLKDQKTGELFSLKLESNPANRSIMKEMELRLLGLQLNQNLNYLGDSYKIIEIDKNNLVQ